MKWHLSGIILLQFLAFFSAYAQMAPGEFADANNPTGAPDPTRPGSLWSVDPISGQVNVKIPFLTTPNAARGPHLPFALLYNSSSTVTLQAQGTHIIEYTGGMTTNTIYQWSPKPIANSQSLIAPAGPWGTSGPYFYSDGSQFEDWGFTDTNGAYHINAYGCYADGPYTYVDENGSAHDMNMRGFSSSYSSLTGPCSAAKNEAATYWPTSNSTDGSSLKTGTLFVYTPDGTYVQGTFAANSNDKSASLADPNGNTASLSFVSGVATATDALGRMVYETNIPINTPGQIPAGSYYVKTYDVSGTLQTYTVIFSTISIGSFTMPHPTSSEIGSTAYCYGTGCSGYRVASQPSSGDTFTAVTEIDLPDSTSYQFSYDSTYGALSKISFPTGGSVSFTWTIRDKDWSTYGVFGTISSIVVNTATVSDGSSSSTWTYALKSLTTNSTPFASVSNPDGTRTDYTGACFVYSAVPTFQSNAKPTCRETSSLIYDANNVLIKTVGQNFNSQGLPIQTAPALYDASSPIQQLVQRTYDSYNNVTELDESDFYNCSSSPCSLPTQSASLAVPSAGWKRITYTTYAHSSNTAFLSAHIVNKPSTVIVEDGSGTPLSLTTYTYDSKGNLAQEGKCMNISGAGAGATCATSWQSQFSYDSTGQVTQKIEGYGSTSAATTAYTWGGTGNGYLVTTKHPNGASDNYTYYGPTGALKAHTDWNGQTTSYEYSDTMNRITKITSPVVVDGTTGSSSSAVVEYSYIDSESGFTVQEKKLIDASGTTTTNTKKYDGLGRITSVSSVVPTTQCSNGEISTDTTYDVMGRVATTSNPYCTSSDSTYGITTYSYDALGRKTKIKLPGGAASNFAYAGNASIVIDPNNGTTSVQHIQQTDGLGMLTDVCEVAPSGLGSDSSASSCGLNISGAGYLTHYTYSAVGNLVSVNQHGLSRQFQYDGLSRLTQSNNPEAGKIVYTYSTPASACSPNYEAPCTRTDARGVVTTYTYDNLNRLTSRSYAAASTNTVGTVSDLTACYQYDTALSSVSDSNPLGKLTAEWEQPGACPSGAVSSIPSGAIGVRILGNHDSMGRPNSDQQCLTVSDCSTTVGSFAYSYDLLGLPVQTSNGIASSSVSATQIEGSNSSTANAPSITWKSGYDLAGHLTQAVVQDQPSTSVWPAASTGAAYSFAPTLISATAYDPLGHMTSAQLGIGYGGSTGAVQLARAYDSLGRLTSETDSGTVVTSAATPGTGTITIAGSEQSTVVYTVPATAGTATITVSGTASSTTTQTITAKIGGYTGTVSYSGTGIPSGAIVGMVVGALSNTGAPVRVSYSGSTITVTATSTGSATNYSLSIQTSQGSIYISAPSSLSGGADASSPQTVYDSGTIAATINGAVASYSWGSGSTATSIASGLASSINSLDSSFLTAGNSANVVTLTSTSKGSAANWSISAVVTYNSSYFTKSSYTATASGMSGGSDIGTNAGTIYSYTVNSYASNSNILAHTDSVMGTWSFSYDAVDRLITAQAGSNVPGAYAGIYGCWGYDSFGNRTAESMSTTACTGSPYLASWATYSYSALNNRMQTSSYAASGVLYDASGNVSYDGRNNYWYDAEGRVCAVQTISSGLVQYIYGPEGERIAQGTFSSVPSSLYALCAAPSANGSSLTNTLGLSINKRYLVDLAGNQVTELNGAGTWLHSNIFIGGRLLSTYDSTGLHFALTDPLGTKRVQANIQGQVDEQCTSLPFGNDLNNPLSVSCTSIVNSLQTNSDATEHHFTGKERDAESGNDYFGARYYASSMGRWLSPDWSAKEEPVPYAKLDNPQTLNLYAYVGNNPITHIDLDGHLSCIGFWCSVSGQSDPRAENYFRHSLSSTQRAAKNSQAQQNNKEVSTVYNETSGLQPVAGKSTSANLHDARKSEAHAYENGGNFQSIDHLSPRELTAIKTFDPAKAAFADSVSAVREARNESDPTHGATIAIQFDPQNQPKQRWAHNTEVVQVFGPFVNSAGGGDVKKGHEVYIMIMRDLNLK